VGLETSLVFLVSVRGLAWGFFSSEGMGKAWPVFFVAVLRCSLDRDLGQGGPAVVVPFLTVVCGAGDGT